MRSIADRLGISERTVRRAEREALRGSVEENVLDQFNGWELLARIIRAQLAALDRLEQLAANPDNTAAGVGACRAISSTGADLIDSLIHAGRLPDPSEGYELRLRTETTEMVRAVHRVIAQLGIPSERLGPAIEAQRALAERVRVVNGNRP